MKNLKLTLFSIFLVLLSCEPEPIYVIMKGEESEKGTKSVAVSVCAPVCYDTRSSYGSEVETIFSGAVLAAYNTASGVLDSKIEIKPSDLHKEITMNLPQGHNYDFYLLANVWKIDRNSSENHTVDIPSYSDEMKAYSYRMDSGRIDSRFRRESMDEVALYGIPMAWSLTDVDIDNTDKLDINMERLFSKLILTIDHSGISASDLEAFVNASLSINNVNNRLMPFSDKGSKAESAADVNLRGDSQMQMENGLVREFVFYVPENLQGRLLPDNQDPYSKNRESVESVLGASSPICDCLTYIEFVAKLNSSSSGFNGELTYRFYIGQDDVQNFDIRRNEELSVRLSFNVESLFKPSWKIDTENLNDTRSFYLSSQRVSRLPDRQLVAVRKNRPARFNLNLKLTPSSSNVINSARLVDASYVPTSISDYAWTSDCWSATHNDMNEPQRRRLADYGISVSYGNGSFVFSVSDESRFVTGVEIPVSFTLFPGGRKLHATIKTLENISVTEKDGLSIMDNFYMAQKRSLEIDGFAASKIYYAAQQGRCGNNFIAKEEGNRQWKRSNSDEAPFPTAVINAYHTVVYPYQDPSLYADQYLSQGEDLDMYAWLPNEFRAVVQYTGIQNDEGQLIICTEDMLNDETVVLPYRIMEPYYNFRPMTERGHTAIPYDGTPANISYLETDFRSIGTATTPSVKLTADYFDPVLYEKLMLAQYEIVDNTENGWLEALEFDREAGTIALKQTVLNGIRIEDDITAKTDICTFTVRHNPRTKVFLGEDRICTIRVRFPE